MIQCAEDDLDRLEERHPQFDARAYGFVLRALDVVIRSLADARHISGRELSAGVRDLALEEFGILARSVLEHWGVRSSDDIGQVVFAMIDQGILVRDEGDELGDFSDAFDFVEAFEVNYPWGTYEDLLGRSPAD
jgi:uncharacterized repeat protein (TIGR04138 family)